MKQALKSSKGVSSWCDSQSDGLWDCSKRVQISVPLLHSFWTNTLGKGMNPLILPAKG